MFQKLNINVPKAAPLHWVGSKQTAAVGTFLFNNMEKIIGIYKITNPKNHVYIGQSVDIKNRISKYKNLNCKTQPKLFNSINKYGWDAHTFEIITTCTPDELKTLEKYYVDLYQSFNTRHGLNVRDGGGSNGSPSPETREKLRQALLNRSLSVETRNKMSVSRMGRKTWNKGIKQSEQAKAKMRITPRKKGADRKAFTAQTIERMIIAQQKRHLK